MSNVHTMTKQYSVSMISNRCPLTVFYNLLNIGGINSFEIFKANNQIADIENPISRSVFHMKLAKETE